MSHTTLINKDDISHMSFSMDSITIITKSSDWITLKRTLEFDTIEEEADHYQRQMDDPNNKSILCACQKSETTLQ